MKTTAILNLKGGVAKTTTAINLAAVLAKYSGKRVLLVDADTQCNLTEFCGVDPEKTAASLVDVIQCGKTANPDFVIQKSSIDGVDIIPASDELMGLDVTAMKYGAGKPEAIREFLQLVRDRYDFCLIDCPPAFNASGLAALVAADNVLIPIKLDAFSLRGMGNLMRQISNMRKINPRLKLSGVLPTMWYRDAQMQDAEKMLADAGLTVFPHIRRSDKVDRMTWQQRPLLATSPNSAAGVDYRRFVKAYMRGGKENV